MLSRLIAKLKRIVRTELSGRRDGKDRLTRSGLRREFRRYGPVLQARELYGPERFGPPCHAPERAGQKWAGKPDRMRDTGPDIRAEFPPLTPRRHHYSDEAPTH